MDRLVARADLGRLLLQLVHHEAGDGAQVLGALEFGLELTAVDAEEAAVDVGGAARAADAISDHFLISALYCASVSASLSAA